MLRAELGSEAAAVARLGHDNSRRRNRPFFSLCCPSLVTLPVKPLLMLKAGTIFLDEVGELAGPLQPALVNVLDRLSARGDLTPVISATRHDLDEEIRNGHFREDLFFRLNVVEIRIPPLRERPDDILPLARMLVSALSAELGRRAPELSDETAAALLRYHWPANLRELKNAIERALLTCPDDVLGLDAFTEMGMADVSERPRVGDDVTLHDLERAHISQVVTRARSLRGAAAILGMDETTLWRRRKLYQRERDTEGGMDGKGR